MNKQPDTEGIDPGLIGLPCADCGRQSETIFGEVPLCGTCGEEAWQRFQKALPEPTTENLPF